MKSLGKFLAIAMVAVGCSMIPTQKASAFYGCGSCGSGLLMPSSTVISQPAVLDSGCNSCSSMAPVVDTCGTCAPVSTCGTCGPTVLSQPAVIESTPVLAAPVVSQPIFIERRHRRHFFDWGFPYGGAYGGYGYGGYGGLGYGLY